MNTARRAGFLGLLISAWFWIPAHAQQATTDQSAKKPAKPASTTSAVKSATTSPADARARQTRQWTIDDALPSRTPTREPTTASSPGLGRVPVESGSFGFSTETKVDPYRTPDGNRIRGLESGQSDPSYLGLSLSVTREDKSILPRSILPNW
jgi:hypothetical protein